MKKILAVVLAFTTLLSLVGCGKNNKLTVDTVVGTINASDYYNWKDYEQDVIKNYKLSGDIQKEIDETITSLKNGTATEKEIQRINSEYGSADEYKEYLINSAKADQVRLEAIKNITIEQKDRDYFIANFQNTFGGMNALVFQFKDAEIASQFYSENCYKSQDEILNYIGNKANDNEIKWDTINNSSEKTGISILINGDSNKYNYCSGDVLKEKFNTLVDGQMSEPFEYSGIITILIRVSNNKIEKDDALIDNYMLKIKEEEAYKKYIIEHK